MTDRSDCGGGLSPLCNKAEKLPLSTHNNDENLTESATENKNVVCKEKKIPSRLYWSLFMSTFTISAFTFGGGYVIVPLMQKKFVNEKKWVEEDEMLDLVAIAQSAPGPIAVNASILAGYRIARVPGAFIAILGTTLPPLIIIAIISYFYLAFRDNRFVSAVLAGMQAGMAAVVVDVVIDMAGKIFKNKKAVPVVVMFLAFAAAAILKISIIIILLFCGAIGAFTVYRKKMCKKEEK